MCQSPPASQQQPQEARHYAPIDSPSSPESEDDYYTSTGRRTFRARDSLTKRTVTLYDWDDTFFPSTYLAEHGVRIDLDSDSSQQNVSDKLLNDLKVLEDIVIKILQEAMTCGIVKVITNAEEGWVELSGSKFMPRLSNFIKVNNIKIVSARTCYEHDFPDSPSCWKTAAFQAEVDESFPDSDYLNVLVLGDSLSEREAAHNLALRRPASCVKSVKLVERPDVIQLQRQIAMLQGSFQNLSEHFGSFDINLQC